VSYAVDPEGNKSKDTWKEDQSRVVETAEKEKLIIFLNLLLADMIDAFKIDQFPCAKFYDFDSLNALIDFLTSLITLDIFFLCLCDRDFVDEPILEIDHHQENRHDYTDPTDPEEKNSRVYYHEQGTDLVT